MENCYSQRKIFILRDFKTTSTEQTQKLNRAVVKKKKKQYYSLLLADRD